MMQQSILLNQVTPEELLQRLLEGLEARLTNFKSQFQPKQAEDLLTREEAAKKLKISMSTLNNWVSKGILQTYGIGGRVYLKNNEIDQAIVKLNPTIA